MINTKPTGITRDRLAEFIKDPRTLREFENLAQNSDDIVTAVDAIQAAPLVGLAPSDVLENDRVVADSANIVFTDGGPKGGLSFDLTATAVAPASYGSATRLAGFTVDAKGRLTFAADYPLNSDNVTEGTGHLYFTQARARLSLSGGTGISYASGTGAIILADTAVAPGTYGDASHSARMTVDQQGRVTAASSVAITIAAVAGGAPAPDGTYANPTSITIKDGIITAIS